MESNPELAKALRERLSDDYEVEDLDRVVRIRRADTDGRPLAEVDPGDLSFWTSLQVEFSVDDLDQPDATREEAVELIDRLASPFFDRGFERDGDPELSMPLDSRSGENWSPDVRQVVIHDGGDLETLVELTEFAAQQRRSAAMD